MSLKTHSLYFSWWVILLTVVIVFAEFPRVVGLLHLKSWDQRKKKTISTHFGTVSPLSMFFIILPLYIQKTKPLYTSNPFPVIIKGISLCANSHREFPVTNTGSLRTRVPCNENRFFPLRISTQGKPCSGPALALFWPCSGPVLALFCPCSVPVLALFWPCTEVQCIKNVSLGLEFKFELQRIRDL